MAACERDAIGVDYKVKVREKIMKMKRMVAGGLAALMAVSMMACGKPKTSMDIDYKVSDYVTLGKYKGLEVTVTGDYSTETALASMIQSAGSYAKDESQTIVQKDSIVNVDYVGKLDGTAFDGGTATDQTLDVGNNSMADGSTSFVPGFTDGLVGAKVGSTVDCNVTFPADYQSTNLAGKEVVFTFTVNYIAKKSSIDTLTDEYVKQNFNLNSVDELKESARERAESSKTADIREAVTKQLVKNAKIKFPKDMLKMRLEEYETRFKKQYLKDGTSLEDYLSQNYNMTKAQFESQVKATLKENLQLEMALEAVAEKENIKFDQKGYDKYVKNLMDNNNVTKKKELYKLLAATEDAGEKYLKKMYVDQKACDFCVDKAKVTVETAEKSTETSTETSQ
ncbi:MAG: trigger factor [Lachnospiraceae bacterium]|nr:trigger factor [Lachnospiraceae bacterium]